jgi:tetratricopeptide (TPR) repeat protein
MPGSAAEALNQRGNEQSDRGWLPEAEASYRRAAEADPEWSVPWYNLGLLCKNQGRWEESLEYNHRATDLAVEDRDAWWNLGIAATALGRWSEARQAWFRCGLSIPPGEGAPACDFGAIPVRLNPQASGEVVWAERIDPARAIVQSIPLAASGFRFRDVVLHDGAARGYRRYLGRELPVFDVLTRLEGSSYVTFEVRAEIESVADYEVLARTAADLDGAAENWATTIRYTCKACSEGRPHHLHDTDAAAASRGLPCAVAARDRDHLDRILSVWLASVPHVRLLPDE